MESGRRRDLFLFVATLGESHEMGDGWGKVVMIYLS